jgi:hypothetical protein
MLLKATKEPSVMKDNNTEIVVVIKIVLTGISVRGLSYERQFRGQMIKKEHLPS